MLKFFPTPPTPTPSDLKITFTESMATATNHRKLCYVHNFELQCSEGVKKTPNSSSNLTPNQQSMWQNFQNCSPDGDRLKFELTCNQPTTLSSSRHRLFDIITIIVNNNNNNNNNNNKHLYADVPRNLLTQFQNDVNFSKLCYDFQPSENYFRRCQKQTSRRIIWLMR